MLIESTAHLPISLAMLDGVFNAPDGAALGRIILRWSHFVAGVTWIGLLYFFNLVNVPFQKGLDADTKKKGDQKFSFIGKEAFTKAGQVRYEKTKKETFVYLNTDSDKSAEAVIKLKGAIDLSKGWFVL